MDPGQLLILGAGEVQEVLGGRERDILATVRAAYLAHHHRQSCLPHSTFLRFPDNDANRIIALPAFLGDGFELAGVKWIASFPGNVLRGMPRASAVVVLNSCETGRPEAVLEGSIISARRTAASAALAAEALAVEPPEEVGLVGTGLINFEVARFLRVVFPDLARFVVYDLDPERAAGFGRRLDAELEGVSAEVAATAADVLGRCRLVSYATTAVEPHVDDLKASPPGSTILHVSLRDLSADAILDPRTDNVVDDPDHVCRARTSVHLAEQVSGGRDFIRCTLSEILDGVAPARRDPQAVAVFSPFGLGVLDLAVAQLVLNRARDLGRGTRIDSFLPSD